MYSKIAFLRFDTSRPTVSHLTDIARRQFPVPCPWTRSFLRNEPHRTGLSLLVAMRLLSLRYLLDAEPQAKAASTFFKSLATNCLQNQIKVSRTEDRGINKLAFNRSGLHTKILYS